MVLALLASFAVGTFEVGFTLFGGQTLGLTSGTMATMYFTCNVAMLVAQSMRLLPAVRRRIDHRWVAATYTASAIALSVTSVVSDAGALGLLIAVVAAGVGMIGPVLSYELLERDGTARGALPGRQAAAGNVGQALGSVSAGSLFALHPAANRNVDICQMVEKAARTIHSSEVYGQSMDILGTRSGQVVRPCGTAAAVRGLRRRHMRGQHDSGTALPSSTDRPPRRCGSGARCPRAARAALAVERVAAPEVS